MTNRFGQYNEEINAAWIYLLQKSFNDINDEIFSHCKKSLNSPNWAITPESSPNWGSWEKNNRCLSISLRLLRNFEWAAVEDTLRHEMAHMIVGELWEGSNKVHGALWKRACEVVNIDPIVKESLAAIEKRFNGVEENPVVSKIHKLLSKGSDKACTEEEAHIFLGKAEELMFRHNIKVSEGFNDAKPFFIKRPVGKCYRRFPSWLYRLGRLVSEHYNVQYINTCRYEKCICYRYVELFGEPQNLDVAEYIYHALLNQGELLYERFKKEHQERCKTDDEYRDDYYRRGISKNAFMEGLISGYSWKLNDSSDKIRENLEEEGAIIPTYDSRSLDDMYKKTYRIVNSRSSGSTGIGWGEGRAAGSSLTLSQGISHNGNQGLVIGA